MQVVAAPAIEKRIFVIRGRQVMLDEDLADGARESPPVSLRRMTINRAVPNIRTDRPEGTRDFFVELLGFEVRMDLGWVATLAAPTSPPAR